MRAPPRYIASLARACAVGWPAGLDSSIFNETVRLHSARFEATSVIAKKKNSNGWFVDNACALVLQYLTYRVPGFCSKVVLKRFVMCYID